MTLTRRRVELISTVLIILLTAGASLMFLNHHLERSFVTYRVAQNLRLGHGFVYNIGQPFMSNDSSPLFALLLSLFSPLGDLPILSNIIGVIAIGLGGIALFGLANFTDEWTALVSALLYITFPLLWITLGLDSTLWITLCLIGLWLYLKEWSLPAALILALALVMRPLTAALLLIVAADFIATGKPFRFIGLSAFAILTLVGAIWMVNTFGSIGPMPGAHSESLLSVATPSDSIGTVLFALPKIAVALFALSPLWIVLPLLSLIGLLKFLEHRWIMLLSGWAILHLLTLVVLGTAVYVWDLLPLIPAIVGLTAQGARWLTDHIRIPGATWAIGVIGSALVILASGQSLLLLGLESSTAMQSTDALHPLHIDPIYYEVGDWLQDNSGSNARIATSRSGLLGYTVGQRPILDMQGYLAEPEFTLPPADLFSWLVATKPDIIVLRQSEAQSLNGLDMHSDAWFTSMYEETARLEAVPDALLIYRRTGESRPFSEPLTNMVQISIPLALNRIGTDFSLDPLEGGRTGMVRLQWLAEASLSGKYYVAIRIQNREGAIAGLSGRVMEFTGWPIRTIVTSYHTIDLAPTPAAGVYDVSVGIGTDANNIEWHRVVQAKVPFGENIFLGGISGARQQFGEINLIGYRLTSTPEALEVLLLWEAARKPVADYRILIQVRDTAGAIVAQSETEPYNGAYPTSAWSEGEQVPDTYLIPTTGLSAGDYQVFVGLIAPDGVRLRTAEGLDVIFIGRLTIQIP